MDMAKHSSGWMLILTNQGLFRFDGYKFERVFTGELDAPQKIVQGQKGRIYSLHKNGVYKIRIHQQQISFHLLFECRQPQQLFEDESGAFWVHLYSGEILLRQGQNQTVFQLNQSFQRLFFAGSIHHLSLIFTDQGHVFRYHATQNKIVIEKSLLKFNQILQVIPFTINRWIINGKNSLGLLTFNNDSSFQLVPLVSNIKEYNYIGIRQQEIFAFAGKEGLLSGTLSKNQIEFQPFLYANDSQLLQKIDFKNISQMYLDDHQCLWLASGSKLGILTTRLFVNFDKSLPFYSIYGFTKISNGLMYLAGDDLYKIKETEQGRKVEIIPDEEKRTYGCIASEGEKLWLGTDVGIVSLLQGDKITRNWDFSKRGGTIFYMYIDRQKNTWFCQTIKDKELPGITNIDTDLQVNYYGKDKGLKSRILVAKESPTGRLFLGGMGADSYLYVYDPLKNNFNNLSLPLPFHVDHFEVNDLAIDKKGNIWLASNVGLLKYDLQKKEITRIDFGSLLTITEKRSLVFDAQQNLWIDSVLFGLICLKNNDYCIFPSSNGLPANFISYRSLEINPQGYLYLLTSMGFFTSTCLTNQIKTAAKPTLLSLSVKSGKTPVLNANMISSAFRQDLQFTFSSFIFPFSKAEYQYRIIEKDEKWIELQNTNSFTLIKPENGSYTIEIKGRSIDGFWSEPLKLSLTVHPVWYKTFWAYLFYITVIFLSIWALIRINVWRLQKEKEKLNQIIEEKTKRLKEQNTFLVESREEVKQQKEVIEEKNTHLETLNKTKDRLFSIISHDLRGPLFSLKGFFDLLEQDQLSQVEIGKMLPLLKADVSTTVELTNNLLNWARDQMGGVKVEPRDFCIREMIENNAQLLGKLALSKGIILRNHLAKQVMVFADPNMMDVVVRNLMGNAIKFCNKNDHIDITAMENGEKMQICIADTGIGISKQSLESLFSLDMISTRGTANEKGTGLGLLLCKEFVEKNNGTIEAESEENQGSKFYFTLPKSNLIIQRNTLEKDRSTSDKNE